MGKFGPNWLIDYRDTKFWRKCMLWPIREKGMAKKKKNFISKSILVFDFTSVYQILSKSVL